MTAPALPDDVTVAVARRILTSAFTAAGLDSPEADTRLLVAHAMSLEPATLAAAGGRRLKPTEIAAVTALVERRLNREPVSRICGRRAFWTLDLRVTPDVLDPRPDTETVIEAVLAALPDERRKSPLRIADLGVGSGALLISLLRELPRAFGVGTDRSRAALDVARDNAQRHDVASRAAFVACDYGSALAGGFDLVVSNPPYIRASEIAGLDPEVRDHDPRLALDGGPDGLDAYRALAADAARLLAPDGLLFVECGFGQSRDVAAILVDAGLRLPYPPRLDLSGIPRVLAAAAERSRSPSGEN